MEIGEVGLEVLRVLVPCHLVDAWRCALLQVEESPPQAIGADMMQERREAFLPVPGNGRAEQTLDRRVTSPYASYLQRDPWFRDSNLRALSGRTCPRRDQAFLQRLIDYGIATGYLRGRTVQRTSG